MDHVGIDVHKRDSQICWLTEAGEIQEQRIRTTRARFEAVFGGQAPVQILVEASTESEWVAQCLEGLGHRVIVADPGYAPMYPRRGRRQKNDRRDALALARASRAGTYRAIHRVSAAQRGIRELLAVRDQLVGARTGLIAVVRSLVRGHGQRVASSSAGKVVGHVETLSLPEPLATTVTPLLRVLTTLTTEIETCEARLVTLTAADARVARLRSVPVVGPITAAAFVATVDEARRFADAGQVTAYLGLVPRDRSSGEGRRSGRITKAGPSRMRWLLVQAAWRLLRTTAPAAQPLRRWGEAVRARRGAGIAVVALARRLARILFALLRDGTTFAADHEARRRQARVAA
jgi:transposase